MICRFPRSTNTSTQPKIHKNNTLSFSLVVPHHKYGKLVERDFHFTVSADCKRRLRTNCAYICDLAALASRKHTKRQKVYCRLLTARFIKVVCLFSALDPSTTVGSKVAKLAGRRMLLRSHRHGLPRSNTDRAPFCGLAKKIAFERS